MLKILFLFFNKPISGYDTNKISMKIFWTFVLTGTSEIGECDSYCMSCHDRITQWHRVTRHSPICSILWIVHTFNLVPQPKSINFASKVDVESDSILLLNKIFSSFISRCSTPLLWQWIIASKILIFTLTSGWTNFEF